MKNIVITGGAGFIGAHVAHELLGHGYSVRALDNLSPQAHGDDARRPAYLDDEVELVVGDVRDPTAVGRALDGADAVVHLAAAVGVGRSMSQMAEYTAINNLGTAVLLEEVAAKKSVRRIVVGSSMSVYGEGVYCDGQGDILRNVERSIDQLVAGEWDPRDADGERLLPLPTDERKPPSPTSVYALSKYDQERLCLLTAPAYGKTACALRLFNTYGPHQALSTLYGGVLAIFASRLLDGNAPILNEDGLQRRDFVSVRDVARAFRLALERHDVDQEAINIGSGRFHSVLDVARQMSELLSGGRIAPEVSRRYRTGDVRHCFADITRARERLHYRPQVSLAAGLAVLCAWLRGHQPVDRVDEARAELAARGLWL
jgi:dTDP-L-rhamnose 4-epimerase